jgi:glucose-6-phosphate 1-dehydrogenase
VPSDHERLVLLGGAGDLVTRHVAPALLQLEERGHLDGARVVAVDRADLGTAAYRDRLASSVRHQRDDVDDDLLGGLLDRVDYHRRDIGVDDLGPVLEGATYVHLALPADVQRPAAVALSGADASEQLRVVVEKPYGGSGPEALDLDEVLLAIVPSDRLLRADHLLHHRAVRDLEALRRWLAPRRGQVDGVRIWWDEAAQVGDRAAFFDRTGALVDMVQSHLLQLVAAVLSPPQEDRSAADVQAGRSEVLGGLTGDRARRGRYAGYPEHPGVDVGRGTETWVGVHLRWQERVPVVLRTGKALGGGRRAVVVQVGDEQVRLDLGGRRLRTGPDGPRIPDLAAEPDDGLTASAHQLLDALRADRTRFLGVDEVGQQWRIADAVRRRWSTDRTDLEEYAPGSLGPDKEDDD